MLGLLIVNLVISFMTGGPSDRERVPYQPFFVDQLTAGNVDEITSQADSIEGELSEAATYDPPGDDEPVEVTSFETEVPAFIDRAGLTELLTDQEGDQRRAAGRGTFAVGDLLLGFLPTLLLIGFFVWLARRQLRGGAGGVLGGFGRATARRFQHGEQERVTFEDVAGIDEAEDELVEIVDFLKRPERYRALGARDPRGVLLYGPPGTGKTLLARRGRGGGRRVLLALGVRVRGGHRRRRSVARARDLFKQAKEATPAIVFIDELDAVGRARSGNVSGLSGGHDEREQTLNQILTEMDGFEADTNVIVLGATNRPEVLDPALLRPGASTGGSPCSRPTRTGAPRSCASTRSLALSPDVDLEQVAAATPGATSADLSLIANEAALFAARRGHKAVEQRDFIDAIEKTILGTERQVVMSDEDRKRTAYHRGDALVGMLTPGADPVRKISIIPRGQALGVTLSTPRATATATRGAS